VLGSSHKGMGSFELLPQAGESYTAVISLPGKTTKSYPLPPIKNSGTVLKVNAMGNDSLKIIVSATSDLASANYYLIGQSRGVVCYAAHFNLVNAASTNEVAKSAFPTGITRFTLFNSANLPLNERIVYIGHQDGLAINISSNKTNYTTRDSVALNIEVKDKDGIPMQGTFSLAVTDDSQVRTDSLGSNIINDLLFTSDLKGTIEQPGWYLENNTTERIVALDNLLLTQGWVGYDWKDVFNNKTAEPKFPAEKEFTVEGKVTNVFNKPVAGTQVALIGKSPMVVKDTLTGKDGRFAFKGLFPVDTAEFKLQAVNKNGKAFNVGIEMLNEFKPPVFAATSSVTPWYVNSDTVRINNANTKTAQLKAIANLQGEGHMLKEVNIKEKKVVKDSKNLNGPGEADQIINEQELLKAGKMSLEEFLEKNVNGFMVNGIWVPCSICRPRPLSYVLNDKMLHIIIDGVDVNQMYDNHTIRWFKLGPFIEPDRRIFLKGYLEYFSAEDVKGIEVMYNIRYTKNYDLSLLPTGLDVVDHIAYIEITTYSGKGPYAATPGTYLYRSLPFTLPKQFYSPKYSVKNNTVGLGTDLRSTIHWEPNVITDSNGKATISFFTADKPADYTIILEGIDLNGSIGYKRKIIKVESNITAAK
ncbi:MAG: hypothetical protein JWQ79_113, partial [Mucilaginibacter sp.]|nr:hypothetical protein [Mucilaginibacter sp.]